VRNAIEPPQRLSHDVLVPHNIKDQFFSWEKELLGASMVNIHSKVIVLDPFGANPVLMTGSHNLGFKASNANDDNLVIIEGNAPLAAAYAINIIAIFQNYRWNNYVEMHRKDPRVWHGLVDNDQWQASYLAGDKLAELNFWLGGKPIAATAAAAGNSGATGAASPARHAVHAVSSVGNPVRKRGTSVATRVAKSTSSSKRAPASQRKSKRKPS
jgi:hypothetical protein